MNDQQWAEAVALAIQRFHNGTTTEEQMSAEIATATANWPTRTLSNAGLAIKISRSLASLTGLVETVGPPDPDMGTLGAMAFDNQALAFYGPKTEAGWGDARPIDAGPPGPSVEMRVDGGFIQWRVEGEASWINLIALSSLTGEDGREIEIQANATHIQWRYVGDSSWTDLIALSALQGADGREIELQTNATHIQWRYVGGPTWTDLIALSALAGPAGGNGWTQVEAIIADGERRVKQIVDWVGGTGTKPATGKYVGPLGLVDTAAEATNVRGPGGTGSGDMIAANNLSDLTDIPQARSNLSVYSKAEIDDVLDGKQDTLGFVPADSADTYTKAEVDGAIDAVAAQGVPEALSSIGGLGSAGLASAISTVKAGRGDAFVLFIGDSTTYGAYGGSDSAPNPGAYEGSFPARLAQKFNSQLPTSIRNRAGDGEAGAANINASDPSIDIGNWSIAPGATMGGKYFLADTTGATMTVTSPEPWDQFELIYVRAGAAETLQVGAITLTGPSAETATVDAKAGTGTSAGRLTLSRAAPAAGAVTMTATLDAGESFYVIGWVFRNSKRRALHFVNAGIRGANTGTSNATPLGLTRLTPADYVMRGAINGVWKPALTFITVGINDERSGGLNPGIATFKANTQLLIDEARKSGSVVLCVPSAISPADEGPVPQEQYRQAIYDLAHVNGIPVVDFQKVLGTYAESVANGTQHDGLHPNGAGYEKIAKALLPVMSAVLEAPGYSSAASIITPAQAMAGLNFDTFTNTEITLTGNLTVGAPSGGSVGDTGIIDIVHPAGGPFSVAWHSNFTLPSGFSIQATNNGRTAIPYRIEVGGKVRLFSPSKWAS